MANQTKDMRKALVISLIIVFLNSFISPVYPFTQVPEYLCELGLKFYNEGNYDQALLEFKKALLAEPNYEPAIKYILMLEQVKAAREKEEGIAITTGKPALPTPAEMIRKQTEPSGKGLISQVKPTPYLTPTPTAGAIREQFELLEFEKAMISEKQKYPLVSPPGLEETGQAVMPAVLRLDETFDNIKQPIEIEKGKSLIVIGKNIQRFLVTQPQILLVEKNNPDELLVTGNDIGYTYLHIWDDNGRWTLEFLGIPLKPEGPTYGELLRSKEEAASNFKLRYTMDWAAYERGRRIYDLERTSYHYLHGLSLIGETPYGDLDSAVSVRTLGGKTELTYYTLGLSNGKFGPFNGFNLRGFDYSPYFSNLALPGANLRGIMLNSPAFGEKINYTAFWGRESGGIYGLFSSNLAESRQSFLEGFNLSYSPTKRSNYKFTVVNGYGEDREDFLPSYDYDLSSSWIFDKGGLTYEIANDSNNFAHLLTYRYAQPKIYLNTELRNIDKDFYSIAGRGWRAGELGSVLNFTYNPTEKLGLYGLLDIYRDRLYPAEDNRQRWNEDFSFYSNYTVDPLTTLRFSYSLQNDLGKLSQNRYQTSGVGITRKIGFIKDIITYADYSHQENKDFVTANADYINDRIFMGLRFSLIGELYYYLNKELNWLQEKFTGTRSKPNVLETGFDWSGQLGNSPFYGDLRFTYHDEEDTVSNLSFLSGQDYIEGYSELSYRTTSGNEIFGSMRMRNIWAENPNVTKRVEANFYAGMRYVWDTGMRWESVGNIEGYVFKDLNSDGLRQRDEPPIEGIRVWLGKDKSMVTDIFGYYKFKGIRARKAYVSLDTSTLPSGFVLTVPIVQEAVISHHRTIKLDFGIVSRSEISGVVFEDIDQDEQYDRSDIGVKGIILVLDDGQKVTTDSSGRYAFSRASVGEHTVTLDLKSVPTFYLPKTTLTKKITLFEGVTYVYNIPLRRIKK